MAMMPRIIDPEWIKVRRRKERSVGEASAEARDSPASHYSLERP
jgi:hypothetical protein